MNAVKKAALVYQAGIANVFDVDSFSLAPEGRASRRLYQGDFRTAEALTRGMKLAGAQVMTAGCNRAGDIQEQEWTADLDSLPFSEDYRPVR